MHGPRSRRARLGRVLAVVLDQRQIDGAVGQMARGVVSHLAGFHLDEAKTLFVKFRGFFQIVDLESDMNDASHGHLLASDGEL